MTFRSEEEKTQDIIMYEKKQEASELCEKYEKIKRGANIATLIALVLFAGCAFPFFYKAYDTESIVGMGIAVLSVIILTVLARIITGAILARSLPVFLKWGSLSSKWTAARKEMHEYEARFADQTVFEDDMKKAEKRLMDASDAIISFAEEKGITVDK